MSRARRAQLPGGDWIAWDEAGDGAPPVVLLHGWCCDRGFLAPQQAHLAARHRSIAIDLPGHGASDAPRRDYQAAALATDVGWLCDRLELARPIVVGHSLGGAVAVELGLSRPAQVAAVVVLDTTIGPAPATRAAWAELVAGLDGPDYRAAARRAIEALYFLPTDDPERRERIVAAMTAAPQHVMRDGMAGVAAWDSERIAGLRVPLLHVARSVGGTDHDHLRRLCPAAFTGRVVGSGHFITLEVPEQVNAMLDRFIAVAGLC